MLYICRCANVSFGSIVKIELKTVVDLKVVFVSRISLSMSLNL